jgi:hypothetical protein
VIFTACPKCERTDFPSRAARDSHVYRCKKSFSPKSIRAEPSSQNQRQTERAEPVKISHPFSDEWRCEKCLHRFTSLEFAQEHYKTRHIDKIPYESETNQKESIHVAKQNKVENPVNIHDQLNEIARQRATQLAQARYYAPDGVVQQKLYELEPSPQKELEPQVEPREEPKQERPNTEIIDSKPQSTAVIDIFKRLGDILKGQNKIQKEPQPELSHIFLINRGVGVDGVNVVWNPKPNYCKNCKLWLYDFEVKQHTDLGHIVVRQ